MGMTSKKYILKMDSMHNDGPATLHHRNALFSYHVLNPKFPLEFGRAKLKSWNNSCML